MEGKQFQYDGMTAEQTRADQRTARGLIMQIEQLSKSRAQLLGLGFTDHSIAIGLLDDERKRKVSELRDTESFKLIQAFIQSVDMDLLLLAVLASDIISRNPALKYSMEPGNG